MAGKLYLCATPIGNLEDISARAIKTLIEVDVIAAEDTRRTGMLLKHFDIKTPMTQYHKFNERKQLSLLLNRLLEGQNIALVSDAGTPGIADPGQVLVKEALEKGIKVVSIPGPCALISALTVSGLDTTSFKFAGFLPKGNQKKKVLKELLKENCTVVCYQSPHDLIDTLQCIDEIDSDRVVVLVREISKIYEERLSGTPRELIDVFEEKGIKGEFTLLFEGSSYKEYKLEDGIKDVKFMLDQGEFLKKACKEVSAKMELSQRELYQHFINSEKK